MLQYELAFSRSPSLFPSSAAKIMFIISALKGSALRWAKAYLHSHTVATLSFQSFLQDFKQVSDHPLQKEEAAK